MPPPSHFPEPLLQEKRHVNALGERQQGETPSPDKARIKPVFLREDKPRSAPGRVSLPAVQPASPSPSPPLRYSPTQPSTSPHSGFLPSFSDSKTWNSVPSIQKYASRLVRPAQYTPPPNSAFELSESGRRESVLFRNWRESGEGSEDEKDTGDEDGQSLLSKQRPQPGLSSGKTKKEYLSQGKETLDQGVQVIIPSNTMGADCSIKDKNQMSPRSREISLFGISPALASGKQVHLPSLSSSSETASSASSVARSIRSTDPRLDHRAEGPAWDPESGVEIFKRKSEDVLARFLKMDSWEEEEGQPPT